MVAILLREMVRRQNAQGKLLPGLLLDCGLGVCRMLGRGETWLFSQQRCPL
jgi:hypothetical protein